MKRLKKLAVCLMTFVLVVALAACHFESYMTYEFNVENGERFIIKLNTTDHVTMTADVPFIITQGGKQIARGTFLKEGGYEHYASVVKQDEKSELLDSGFRDGIEYVFWNYNNEEYNYVMKVPETKTALLLSSTVSEDMARECFNRLTITRG